MGATKICGLDVNYFRGMENTFPGVKVYFLDPGAEPDLGALGKLKVEYSYHTKTKDIDKVLESVVDDLGARMDDPDRNQVLVVFNGVGEFFRELKGKRASIGWSLQALMRDGRKAGVMVVYV